MGMSESSKEINYFLVIKHYEFVIHLNLFLSAFLFFVENCV